jgi:hypothetical protein
VSQASSSAAAAATSATDGTDDVSRPHEREEFADDIISFITYFVARHNGRRSAENRRERIRIFGSTLKVHPPKTANGDSSSVEKATARGRKKRKREDEGAAAAEKEAESVPEESSFIEEHSDDTDTDIPTTKGTTMSSDSI